MFIDCIIIIEWKTIILHRYDRYSKILIELYFGYNAKKLKKNPGRNSD